ncbi:hypothetical protein [Methylomonas methanica]|uniref:Uncharacterized protein n=1 Tax=Methylomonas methanica (strain DSM 25384 / MC09) TaxID=857087 RepID=F9ZWX3_METMM|nr:hypothetical protein [Methylomonas methanica]AEG02135.1 hypothetical protein Metme_3777 [Methylomonas methanica MC09]
MRISEQNLKQTCTFIVEQYRRGAPDDQSGQLYRDQRNKLNGLSIVSSPLTASV